MKTLLTIVGLIMTGMAVNAQSIQNNNGYTTDFNNDKAIVVNEMDNQMIDVQAEDGLVLVLAFDEGNYISGINSIGGYEDITIKSYPNPATDQITVDIANYNIINDIQFSIYNINGQQVGNWMLVQSFSNGNSFQLNVSNLPKGTYVLQVNSDSVNLHQTKLIEKL